MIKLFNLGLISISSLNFYYFYPYSYIIFITIIDLKFLLMTSFAKKEIELVQPITSARQGNLDEEDNSEIIPLPK